MSNLNRIASAEDGFLLSGANHWHLATLRPKTSHRIGLLLHGGIEAFLNSIMRRLLDFGTNCVSQLQTGRQGIEQRWNCENHPRKGC